MRVYSYFKYFKYRSTSPDSVIESGSDSASVAFVDTRLSVKGALQTPESEFGSLTSVNIAAGAPEDDLDSGIDGIKRNKQQNAFINTERGDWTHGEQRFALQIF